MRKYSSYPLLLSTVPTVLCFFFLFIHFEPEHAVLSFTCPCPWISPKALCQARQPDAASEIPGISAARGAGGSLEVVAYEDALRGSAASDAVSNASSSMTRLACSRI